MTVNSAQVFLPDLYNNQAGVTLVTGPDRSASSECGATGSRSSHFLLPGILYKQNSYFLSDAIKSSLPAVDGRAGVTKQFHYVLYDEVESC